MKSLRSKRIGLLAGLFVLLMLAVASSLALADAPEKIYYVGTDKAKRADLDGSNDEVLFHRSELSLGQLSSIAVDATRGKVYVSGGDPGEICRFDLDGSNKSLIISTGFEIIDGMDVDEVNGKLYWIQPDWTILRADLDGSNEETVLNLNPPGGGSGYIQVDPSNGKIYWSDYWSIRSANLDGTNEELLFERTRIASFAIDAVNGHVYWTNSYLASGIKRVNFDGTGEVELISGGRPSGIALDVNGGKMYWGDPSLHQCKRADLDGSNVEVIGGVAHCHDVDLGPAVWVSDSTPPEITPNVSGTLGDNDWYTSDVTVSWDVTDDESEVTETSGCDTTVINADTAETTLTCEATSAGGTASESVTIKRDATAPTLTIVVPQLYDVQPVGTALDFSAEDTLSQLAGPAVATLTSETESVVMASGEQPGVGVYSTVVVEATDNAGNTATSEPRLLVIYDPAGGFVTGGGWIMSPADACPVFCGGATGKANFGFVSKYKKGASTPTGNTEFQFKAGDLNFHSSSYDWLVIAGANAKYKGVGTINGEGEYGFMLTATDEDLTPSTDVDLFRIKIWDKATDVVVYDNKMGEPDDGYAGTEIGGGNIKVHKK